MPPNRSLESARSFLRMLKSVPATVGLIITNVSVFIAAYLQAGSLDGPHWMLTLMSMGAQFNPFTLDKEWYRIFTYMFLHGGPLHLMLNMVALAVVGAEVEKFAGTKKFLAVYFVCGIAAAMTSLYWNLFLIVVGASGAIFGLFGFSLTANMFARKTSGKSIYPLLVQFVFFVGLNLLIADLVKADNAAHFGGLLAGIVIGLHASAQGKAAAFRKVKIEYFIIPLLFVVYFMLPRYQVRYYKLFQEVMAAEDSSHYRSRQNLSDEQYIRVFIKDINQWDAVLQKLNRQKGLPEELHMDTFNLRRYMELRKRENIFKKSLIQQESYVYLDSIEAVQERIPQHLALTYNLKFRINEEESEPDTVLRKTVKVLYDSHWVETKSLPAVYYRIGFRDSLGRWEGRVKDYYIDGNIQMKGTYRRNKRDGIFLYYSDHNTYTSAGRYENDRPIGKWENYHDNGRLASEVYFNNGFFLKNLWDSLGNQLVVDGNGREIHRHANGVIATEGEYRYGLKEGYWYGHHPNGEMYYEEHFSQGKLLSGKSRTLEGETFVYDATSLQPMPEEGFEKFHEYIKEQTEKVDGEELGHVRLSFRVMKNGSIADLTIEQNATPRLDAIAKDILLNGPRWLPAREHGHEPVDGWSGVLIEFY